MTRSRLEAAAPGDHTYVVVGGSSADVPSWAAHVEGPHGVAHIVRERDDWRGATLNGLAFETAAATLPVLPRDLSLAWYVWGYEAYGHWPALRDRQFLPLTRRLVSPQPFAQESPAVRSLLGRLDFCVTIFPEEYELFRQCGLPGSVQFHLGSVALLEDHVDLSTDAESPGSDIQLGNSASLTNNHLDALGALAGLDLGERRVFVPLTYGDPRYRDMIIQAGRALLGERLVPLVEFVPQPEYRATMQRCGVVVMAHVRQQAWGNIVTALWRGSRLFMNDTPISSN
jgi:hypothetical protein